MYTYIHTYIHTRYGHPYMEMHTKLLYSVTNVKNVSTDEVFPDAHPELPWFEYGGVRSSRVRHR